MLGDAHDLDPARAEVDGEQHIVGPLAQPADDIDGEKVDGDQLIAVVSDERLSGRIGAAPGRWHDAMAIEDRRNRSVRG